ncbi:hypothetical protein HU762_12080 [Pseudomonas sp. SWRI92]|uniref:capsular polysaccharide export protein, LipB/KpsS family n=1 Tax=Pseudomonas sp. SWRI92 TaxID=2745499 RepID=UPI00164529F0|nr:hypothetical protein [Pseudomonas sp. SWRI92]MBC3374679.1 hypothetical protein [Pseudomonas sp. SWRI92]
MNILLLSNGAPGYHRFFNALMQLFSSDGHQFSVAVDSEFSKDQNNLGELGCEVYEFSSFFSAHLTDHMLLARYSDCNLNSALLSDYERAETYKIAGGRDLQFYERLKSALLSFFEKVILGGEISLVVYEGVSNAFAHFAYFVCVKHGVSYKGLMGSRLPGRFVITDDPCAESKKIENIMSDISSGRLLVDKSVKDWCEQYLDNIENLTPDYMSFNRLDKVDIFKRYFNMEKLRKLFRIIRHLNDDHKHSFQIGNPLKHSFQMFKRNFYRKLKVGFVARYYLKPVPLDRFFLYPLHFHPEASTSILAGAYLNEYEVIRNIAFNLPQGTVLYVKDHMSAFAFPELKFYKKLAALPNVKLLAPDAPTKTLIKNSEAVITLTSTVGYEALLLDKKVYLFGRVFYEFHPDVIRIENPTQIFDLLTKGKAENMTVGREYNLDFLAAFYLYTRTGRLNLMASQKEAIDSAKNIYPEICL